MNINNLTRRVAVVTGATSGIGRALVLALSKEGAQVCAIGRDQARLTETVEAAERFTRARDFRVDLTEDAELDLLAQRLEQEVHRVDILVHSAGVFHHNPMTSASIEDLDLQYATNVRAPYQLTQLLLPMLTAASGQLVFVNSSLGVSVRRPEVGQYAATKHALKAIADSLREEVNVKGVRVLSVYLGRTATPMQETVYRHEQREYRPELLLQPEDVASLIVHALLLPRTAEVTDIMIRPMEKSY